MLLLQPHVRPSPVAGKYTQTNFSYSNYVKLRRLNSEGPFLVAHTITVLYVLVLHAIGVNWKGLSAIFSWQWFF